MNRTFLILVFQFFLTSIIFAQNGTLRGTVFDSKTGEPIPGATIFLEGTTLGTMTDLDGKFNLSAPVGVYKLRVSFISYNSLFISDVNIKSGQITLFDNLKLQEATLEISTVTVTAQQIRNTETAMLSMKKKSANLLDGISAVTFKKIGDSDAASSMKRVSGVSVSGGKYVFVRGLGDRYTKTTLNGVDIPGLDPDRNTIQMDLFPTNVIDNIVVHKSFSAELPADFTGGIIDISIKDFPEKRTGGLSISTSYNPYYHFNKNYLTYETGDLDFLGFDDGTRDIPASTNIPQFAEVVGNPDGDKAQRYKEILKAFNPNLAAYEKTSLLDVSVGASIGNQIAKEKYSLGYNFSISYKNETEFYKDAIFARYGLSGNQDIFEMEKREYQKGNYGLINVLWSALGGFAYKTNASKIRFSVLRLQNGESKAGIFDYEGSDLGSNFIAIQHNLDYSERSLTNALLDGKHLLKDNKWEIEWKLSPTLSKMSDPDIRFTRYQIRENTYVISTESGFPERIWRDLQELNLSGLTHFTYNYRFMGDKSKLKFGTQFTYKERDFEIKNFTLNVRNVELTGDPNELMNPDNLWPSGGSNINGTSYEAPFIPVNPNKFNSNAINAGLFASTELTFFIKLKMIVGLRIENYIQRYTGQNQLGTIKLNNDEVLNSLDLFPTLNLIYSLTEIQNLRASFTKTIARPSFKELSYAEIYDPITGRTFAGGLFRDANDIEGLVYWDGNLISTDIYNFDLRWELFQKENQSISFSAFYKIFNNPIEMVQFATQTGTYQPRNVGNGNVKGLEFEFSKSLAFITSFLKNMNWNGNITYTQSQIQLSKTELDSKIKNARTGENIEEYRNMAGQSPLIINSGISYSQKNEESKLNGFEIGVYYNVQGRTLLYVGIADRPDIYANPFHSLNLNSSYSFGKDKSMQIGFKIDNILDSKNESVFSSYNTQDQLFSYLRKGRTFQIRFGYNF